MSKTSFGQRSQAKHTGGPNHISILVMLVLFVLLAALVSGLSGYLGMCAFPVLFFALTVGVPSWLRSADNIQSGQPADDWQPLVDQASVELGIHSPPPAIVSSHEASLRVVGAFRRKHIVIGQVLYDQLNKCAAEPGKLDVRPILIQHEMHHIASKDLEELGGLLHALDVFTWASIWSALCALGAIGCLMLLTPPILARALADPRFTEVFEAIISLSSFDVRPLLDEFRQLSLSIAYRLPFTAVAASFLPLLAGCFLLRAFVWRRLVQLRELYADQLAVARFGPQQTWHALTQLQIGMSYANATARPSLFQSFARLWPRQPAHPNRDIRKAAIDDATAFIQALTHPQVNGLTVGIALLAMSLLATSGFTLPVSATWLPFGVAFLAHCHRQR